METQATRIEKLILSALVALVTATVSTQVEIQTLAETTLASLYPGILANQ
ncbi:hypothetical protein ACL6C3_21470 [Capilliphycus salinus ALCB114379]